MKIYLCNVNKQYDIIRYIFCTNNYPPSEMQNNIGVKNGAIVYALFDYSAVNSDELSFVKNDKIEVILFNYYI